MLVRRCFPLMLLALLALSARSADACSIPVFRYASEFWVPDPFELYVFHDQPLTDQQQVWIEQLEQGPQAANITVIRQHVGPAGLVGETQDARIGALLTAFPADAYPHLVLQLPRVTGNPQPIWSGPLTAENLARLQSSPTRTKLVEALADKNTIVWLYLESGDAKRDEESFALLAQQVDQLQQTLQLPTLTEEDRQAISSDLELRLTALRVSRSDPAEATLVANLLATEPDLLDPEFAAEPMAFPIFGRGRVLYALVGAGINAGTIEDACRFLTGSCQCTVKLQNPGADLLLASGWGHTATTVDPEYVPIPGRSSPQAARLDAEPAAESAARGRSMATEPPPAAHAPATTSAQVTRQQGTPRPGGMAPRAPPGGRPGASIMLLIGLAVGGIGVATWVGLTLSGR